VSEYRPNLTDLQELDRKHPEQVKNLREVTTGWSESDARWDALLRAFDFHRREVAHELAEKQRDWLRSEGYDLDCVCTVCSACLAKEYIGLIDPEVPGGD
jgi:hypothetical protein